VQRKLYEYVGGNRTYIASPEVGSKHNRGAAVDITLVDSQGRELEMPSPIHTMTAAAARDNPDMTEAAKANMDYMTQVMTACGLTPYTGEWWHFNDTDWADYMLTDHDLSKTLLSCEAG
jgi:D-alanyl-D-alanine dipeptidase